MGILRTLSTIIAIFVDAPEILAGVEEAVLPAIQVIFAQNQVDFLEDILDVMITCTFVRKAISPQMWAYFPVLYQLWSTECFDYFDGVCTSLVCLPFSFSPSFLLARVSLSPSVGCP